MAVTALMGASAYETSADLAKKMGAFSEYEKNSQSMLDVIKMHGEHTRHITTAKTTVLEAAQKTWTEALKKGERFGYRNAQVTVLAPTGTIGFMMDCDTTGIEPDIALVKYKKMVGGGVFKIVNQTVPAALQKLGYTTEQNKDIIKFIDENDGIEGAPHLKEEHLSVFDCAFKAPKGDRYIHYLGHIKMMAAVQPFISGAISKTVNMPKECTIEEISNVYVEAWKLGLKCVAIYREGSKRIQPLNTKKDGDKKQTATDEESILKTLSPDLRRRRLKDERQSITHKFSIAGHEGYLTIGLFEDGTPGEIFIRMAKEGSTVSGLMDSIATTTSIMLQYGVPLEFMVKKFSHTRFEPNGITTNKHIPFAKSIVDYVFRYLAYKFLPLEVASKYGINYIEQIEQSLTQQPIKIIQKAAVKDMKFAAQTQEDAPPCHQCGSVMVRSGSCYKCLECGETSGCS
jgi:ribonucleoside-diphosphate reductase alpha chain